MFQLFLFKPYLPLYPLPAFDVLGDEMHFRLVPIPLTMDVPVVMFSGRVLVVSGKDVARIS